MSLLTQHNYDNGGFYDVGGLAFSRPESSVNVLQKKSIVKILPRNTVQGSILQGTSVYDVYFDIPNQPLDYCNELYLRMQVQNNDVATMNLVDVSNWFDYIWLDMNGETVQTRYPPGLRNNIIVQRNTEELATLLPGMGISNTDYSSTISLAGTGGTGLFWLPIDTIINNADIPLWRKDTAFRLTCRFRGGSQLISSGTAIINNLTLVPSSVELWMTGDVLKDEVRAYHDKQLITGNPKVFRYLDENREQISCSTVLANNYTTVNVTSSGHLCFFWFMLQPSGATGAQQYDSVPLLTTDFLINNRPVLHDLPDNNFTVGPNVAGNMSFMALKADELWTNSQLFFSRPVYAISASDAPEKGLADGANFGSIMLDGITTTVRFSSSATTNNAILQMDNFFYSHVIIDYATGRYKIFKRL